MMPTIATQRLHNQKLEGTTCNTPAEIVAWLGAVQSQEYALAKWGLAQRLQGVRDANVEQAFTDGAILRTHVMRPTWHFVTAADIRWILDLTAPRVHAVNAYYYRKSELDEALFRKSNDVMIKALEGGKQLTRTELASRLAKIGVVADTLRLSYIMMQAELDGVICSGARRGKQFTYALLAERAPKAKTLPRDEALVELTTRYFTSHGPATVNDFAWWSGLTKAEIKRGLDMAKPHIVPDVIDGTTYYRADSTADLPTVDRTTPMVLLLPPYDEYTIAYKDHSAILAAADANLPTSIVFNGIIAVNGQLAGSWKRTIEKGKVIIEYAPFRPFTADEREAFTVAVQRFGEFLQMPVVIA